MNLSIVTSLIAASSAASGVLLKMFYDATAGRVKRRNENSDRFIGERKSLYDDFLAFNKAHIDYRGRLQELSLIARAGQQVRPEVLAQFPESKLKDLVETLGKMRLLARTNEIVRIAERIIALHGDAAAALRYYATSDNIAYGLPLFLADRFGEDQVLEFISAYRTDLRVGPPEGGGRSFPIIERNLPMPITEAERFLRNTLRSDPAAGQGSAIWPEPTIGKQLTREDIRLLSTPRFTALIQNPQQPTPGQ
jgi:hypothetical protein